MLKSISIENYKCFKTCTTIELAPLTILCGVNSSGKSSIINSLLMAKQSYENSSIENKLELNGKYIKSGSYEDIVYKKEGGRIVFKIGYDLTPPSKKRNIKKTKNEITAFKSLAKMFSKIVDNIAKFRIDTETIIDKAVDDKQINNDILSEQNISIKIYTDKGVQSIEPTIHLKNLQDKQYRMTLNNIPNDTELCKEVVLSDCVCYFEGFKLINAFAYNVEPRVNNLSEILANIYLIFSLNAMQYRSIHYLNPLREYPKMNYNIDNEINSVGLGGEYVPHLMYLHKNQYMKAFLPDNNGHLFLKMRSSSFQKIVQKWMNYLGFEKYSFEKKF